MVVVGLRLVRTALAPDARFLRFPRFNGQVRPVVESGGGRAHPAYEWRLSGRASIVKESRVWNPPSRGHARGGTGAKGASGPRRRTRRAVGWEPARSCGRDEARRCGGPSEASLAGVGDVGEDTRLKAGVGRSRVPGERDAVRWRVAKCHYPNTSTAITQGKPPQKAPSPSRSRSYPTFGP